MRDADAIKEIQRLSVVGHGTRTLEPKAEPPHVYYTIERNASGHETLKKQIAERQPFKHAVNDFETLGVRLEKARAAKNNVSAWYAANYGVIAVLSDDYRDTARLKLTYSEPFKKLMDYAAETKNNGVLVSHADLFSLFRRLFRGAIVRPNQDELVRLIGKINIKKINDVTSGQARSKVSVDRDILAEAVGADALPDTIRFAVPFFAEPVSLVNVTVDVAFDLDAAEEKFRLYVLPGEIEKATSVAEDFLEKQIGNVLSGINDPMAPTVADDKTPSMADFCPVYRGNP